MDTKKRVIEDYNCLCNVLEYCRRNEMRPEDTGIVIAGRIEGWANLIIGYYKKDIDNWVDSLEIDETLLPSYRYDKNPYNLDSELAKGSGEGYWDEEEEREYKIYKAIDLLQNDGIVNYIDINVEEDKYLTVNAINYLKEQL